MNSGTTKQQLLSAIEQAPEAVLSEALHYLQYLTDRYLEELEDAQDLADYREAKAEMEQEGTIPLAQLKQELEMS
jgi:hypothetical protein